MICKRCVLDDTVPTISYDDQGYCNYCTEFLRRKTSILKNSDALANLIEKIKGIKGTYNCIVGISGGLDSSYLLHSAVRAGLKPLAVHIDRGWNTEHAVKNLEVLTKELKIDLNTYVLEWEQFKQIQIAFLRSGVIDIEMPTDHYYLSALYKVAADNGIRYILTGNNYASEGIMPDGWNHNKGDTRNMLDIYKKYGNKTSIHKLPTLTLVKRFYYYNIKKIENLFLLNYLDYNRDKAKETLMRETCWKAYPLKHGESVFTRFYHRYILPNKFNIDIRKAHLSAMICTGQISRDKACFIVENEKVDRDPINTDKKYVLKKLKLSDFEFSAMMSQSVKSHFDFKSEKRIKEIYNFLINMPIGLRYILKISNRH